jgi:hypothetical protein
MKRPALLLLVFVVAACHQAGSTDGNSDANVRICDQSAQLRFALSIAPGGMVTSGQHMLYENGVPFLFVDGQCNYWVSRGVANIWEDVRTGQLSGDEEAALSSDLYYADWARLRGDWRGFTFDGNVEIFSNGTATVVCDAGCDASGVPIEVTKMRDAWQAWTDRLWRAGSPIDGAERIIVVRYDDGQPPGQYDWQPWPLQLPIDSIAVSYAQSYQTVVNSTLVSNAADAQAIRSLRRKMAAGQLGNPSMGAIMIQSGAQNYQLFARDTTPLEAADGLVQH